MIHIGRYRDHETNSQGGLAVIAQVIGQSASRGRGNVMPDAIDWLVQS